MFQGQMFHARNSLVGIGEHLCPCGCSLHLSNLFYTDRFLRHKNRDLNKSGVDNRLKKLKMVIGEDVGDFENLTLFAEFAFITPNAVTFSVITVSMPIAVRYFTFIMPKTAFLSLPTGITLTFSINIFSTLTAKHWTYTCSRQDMQSSTCSS